MFTTPFLDELQLLFLGSEQSVLVENSPHLECFCSMCHGLCISDENFNKHPYDFDEAAKDYCK